MASQAEIDAAIKALKPAERRALVNDVYDAASDAEKGRMALTAALALPIATPTQRKPKR